MLEKIDFNAIDIVSFVEKNMAWKMTMQTEIRKNEK